jgi:hypothetical protein
MDEPKADAAAAVLEIMRARHITRPGVAAKHLLEGLIRACPDWGVNFEECLARARNHDKSRSYDTDHIRTN